MYWVLTIFAWLAANIAVRMFADGHNWLWIVVMAVAFEIYVARERSSPFGGEQ